MILVDPSRMQDDDKFMELVLFLAQRSENDPNFGATKLNKLLFYADFVAYLQFGRAITGHRYQRLRNGPAPRALLPILDRMESAGFIARANRNHYGRTQKRIVALRDADLSLFTANEIALVTQLLQDFASKNAKELSDLSHRFRGWQLAEDGEDIPYEVALVNFRPSTPSDDDRWREIGPEMERLAKECLEKHGT